MNRCLLVLALGCFAAPAYSMTAAVTAVTPPPAAPSAPVTSNSTSGTDGNSLAKPAASKAAADTRTAAPSASPAKPAMANATAVTRPSAVLSAAVVPGKAVAGLGVRSGAAPAKANVMMPGSTPQSGDAPPVPVKASAVATADESAGMRRGTLEAISGSAGTFQVFGQKLTFNPQRVRVFNRDGKPGSAFALKTGANIRFTLDATDPLHRRVGVIYVD